jgi:hypothetical protein
MEMVIIVNKIEMAMVTMWRKLTFLQLKLEMNKIPCTSLLSFPIRINYYYCTTERSEKGQFH